MVSKWCKAACGCVFLLVFATETQGQLILVDDQYTGPVQVAPGAFVPVSIYGSSNVPVLLAVGFLPTDIPTPYGQLGVSFAAGGFFALDGFDPAHPFHTESFLDESGYFSVETMLFISPSMPGWEIEFWTQALLADPTSPVSYTLSNTIEVREHMPAPVVLLNSPNYAAEGAILTIVGQNFATDPALNTVTIGSAICPVVYASSTLLGVEIPVGCQSGPVVVATPWGASVGNTNAINTWCAVINSVVGEAQAGPISSGFTTIQGYIQFAGQADSYTVHALPGQEIYAECYSYDPNTGLLTGGSNSANLYFDPVLEIRHGTVDLFFDDDSGPLTSAAIGLAWGLNGFVADMEADYQVRVRTVFTGFVGHYILKYGVREPQNMPMRVHAVYPNLVRPGDFVSVWCSNTVPGNLAGHTVQFFGQTLPATAVVPGRLEFQVPAGAMSGPVAVTTPLGSTVLEDDRMGAWLTVLQDSMAWAVEGQIPTTSGSKTWFGALELVSDADVYRVQIRANRHYRFEVYAFDSVQTRVMTSTFVMGFPVDPELRVVPAQAVTPILAMDSSAGPGLNAIIGSSLTPYYYNPQDTYVDVWVLPWFMGSSGEYLLNIVELPVGL